MLELLLARCQAKFLTSAKYLTKRVMPVFHLRVFSREANFSFVFGLATGTMNTAEKRLRMRQPYL
jgi:hypothetical protein